MCESRLCPTVTHLPSVSAGHESRLGPECSAYGVLAPPAALRLLAGAQKSEAGGRALSTVIIISHDDSFPFMGTMAPTPYSKWQPHLYFKTKSLLWGS